MRRSSLVAVPVLLSCVVLTTLLSAGTAQEKVETNATQSRAVREGTARLPDAEPRAPTGPSVNQALLEGGKKSTNDKSPEKNGRTSDVTDPKQPAVMVHDRVNEPALELAWDAFGRIEDIKPQPEEPIPDNPPPHEGAMLEFPLTVAPPDILFIAVLETPPGRSVTGERPVRPDGTISLGWYGDVHVRGLTLPRIKKKVILQLRSFMDDEALGLVGVDKKGVPIQIQPEDSDRVIVDVAAYNSMKYFVLGDVNLPTSLPSTGNDTLLDALKLAGHVAPVGNAKDIVLARPASGGNPAKIYNINLESILRGDNKANLQVFPGDRILIGRRPIVQEQIRLDAVAAPLNSIANATMHALSALKLLRGAMDEANLKREQRNELLSDWLDFWVDVAKSGKGEAPTPDETRRHLQMLLEPLLAGPEAKLD